MSGPGHFAPQVVRGEQEFTPGQIAEFKAALDEAVKTGSPYGTLILPSRADTLCHSFVQVPPEFDVPDEHRAGIEISVTATQSYPITADLADRICEIVWESMRAAR